MASQNDLTAERAAALFRKLDEGLYYMREGGKSHQEQDKFGVDLLLQFAQQIRQDALREAKEEIERFIDYSGGCVGTQNDPGVVAVNRFITINIVPLLDRLASEGG